MYNRNKSEKSWILEVQWWRKAPILNLISWRNNYKFGEWLVFKITIYNTFCLYFISWGWMTPHKLLLHEPTICMFTQYAIWPKNACACKYLNIAIISHGVSFISFGLKECSPNKGNTKHKKNRQINSKSFWYPNF